MRQHEGMAIPRAGWPNAANKATGSTELVALFAEDTKGRKKSLTLMQKSPIH